MERDTNNLLLEQPRLLLPEGGALKRGVFYGVLMALGGLGGWGCFITAFGIEVGVPRPVIVGIISILFSVWRQTDSRRRWWSATLVGWVAWLLMLVFTFDGVAHGAVRTVNFMLESYGSKLNYDLPVFSLPYSAGTRSVDIAGECTSFISILMFPFFWSMARMWIKSRNNRAPFGLTGILLLLPMGFSIIPAGWAFAILILFWCMLLLLAPSLNGREGVVGRFRRKGYMASGVTTARPMALALILAVGILMWLVYAYAPMETYERPELAESLRTGLREGFGSSPYLRSGQGNSNKEVELRTLGSRAYTGETMLRVKFDWQADPDGLVPSRTVEYEDGTTWTSRQTDNSNLPATNYYKEYLKSFVGTVYTGHSWERLGFEGRDRLKELELRAQNQISRFKHEMYSAGWDKLDWYRLSVENLGANPRCVYIPASLKSSEEELYQYGIEFVDDGYAKSGDFLSGSREYELRGEARASGHNYFSRAVSYLAFKNYGANNLYSLGSAVNGNIKTDEYAGGFSLEGAGDDLMYLDDMVVKAPDLASMYVSINKQGTYAGQGWPADLWKMEHGDAWMEFSEEQRELMDAVEDYNDFVYEHYLEVPPELEDFLIDFRSAYGLDPEGRIEQGDFRYKDGAEFYAQRIAWAFQDYFTYTLDPPVPPAGRDFVEYFLGESNEGYCVHFASAAVMLLRSAGYPARYAEGYVVNAQQTGWVDVPDYNAHAWVEVYCGGTGWVPVEVTPAAVDNPAAFFDALIPENPQEHIPTPVPIEERPTMPPRDNPLIDEELATPTPVPGASAAPSPGAGSSGGRGSKGVSSGWMAALWGLSVVVAIGGALMLNRILRVKKRERELSQEDRSEAGLRAYAYLLKLYEKEIFCGAREDPPERWKELAEKARFAKQKLTEAELSELTGDAERLAEKLRRQLPRGQKALCWLAGLI